MPLPKNPHPDRHRMLGYPPSAETLRFIGMSEEEWRFVQGRYETARKELTHLRTGIKRVAEVTANPEIVSKIPFGHENGDVDGGYDERGWNYLLGALCAYIEHLKRDLECSRAYAEGLEQQRNDKLKDMIDKMSLTELDDLGITVEIP